MSPAPIAPLAPAQLATITVWASSQPSCSASELGCPVVQFHESILGTGATPAVQTSSHPIDPADAHPQPAAGQRDRVNAEAFGHSAKRCVLPPLWIDVTLYTDGKHRSRRLTTCRERCRLRMRTVLLRDCPSSAPPEGAPPNPRFRSHSLDTDGFFSLGEPCTQWQSRGEIADANRSYEGAVLRPSLNFSIVDYFICIWAFLTNKSFHVLCYSIPYSHCVSAPVPT